MQRSFNSSGPHYNQKHSPGEHLHKEQQFPAEFPGGLSAVTFSFLFDSEVSRRLTEASNAIPGLSAVLLGKQCINGVKTCSSQAFFLNNWWWWRLLAAGGGRTHNSGESVAWFTSNAWKGIQLRCLWAVAWVLAWSPAASGSFWGQWSWERRETDSISATLHNHSYPTQSQLLCTILATLHNLSNPAQLNQREKWKQHTIASSLWLTVTTSLYGWVPQ